MAKSLWQMSSWIPACAGLTQRLVATFVVLLTLAIAPALAAEEIRSYDSNIKLEINGTVDVTETITVNSEGDQIRHGIYRDIPTQLINTDKSRLRSALKVLDVSRDGSPEPYTVDDLGGGYKRIKIGSADVWLDDGVHTYVIHYTMSRMGRFFADHDELFWNATGNFWVFPILKAIHMSLYNHVLIKPKEYGFVGLANYARLLHDEVFWLSLWNSFLWVFGSVSFQFLGGFAAALPLTPSINETKPHSRGRSRTGGVEPRPYVQTQKRTNPRLRM